MDATQTSQQQMTLNQYLCLPEGYQATRFACHITISGDALKNPVHIPVPKTDQPRDWWIAQTKKVVGL